MPRKRPSAEASPAAFLAGLAARLAAAPDLDAALSEAAKAVAERLEADFSGVLRRAGAELRPAAVGAGWDASRAGGVVLGLDSHAGRALSAAAPVCVDDFGPRPYGDPHLEARGVKSGIAAALHGLAGPWGVLGAHWRRKRACRPEEAQLLQAAAGLLSERIQRAEAQEAARRGEARLRDLDDILWETDACGLYSYLSPNVEQVLGYPPAAMLGRKPTDFMPEADAVRVARVFGEIAAHRRPFQLLSHRARRRDGTELTLECSGVPLLDEKGLAGYRGVDRDITERARAGEAARRQEEQYRLLFERHPDAMLIYDLSSRKVVSVNEAAVRLYGYSRTEFAGLDLERLRAPEESARLRAWLGEVPSSPGQGIQRSGVWANVAKDGRRIEVDVSGCTIEFQGHAARLILARDVTSSRAAEAALREQERRLLVGQKMEAVGRLAGGVAHEFNNVLTGIMGLATLIHDGLPEDHPARRDAEAILGASKRAAGLVLRLLTFSRQRSPERRSLDLRELVDRSRPAAAAALGPKVRLDVELGREPLPVEGDSALLDQVLLNLCLNARDATASGGRVELSCRRVTLPQALSTDHGALPPGAYAVVSVADRGRGISPENSARVFEPFFSTHAPGRSAGLGLSIAYAVAREHDGLITFEPRPGGGTVFCLYLPAARPAPPPPAPAAAAPRGFVLVADDEEVVRSVIERTLKPRGYRLLSAKDGEEALLLFERHQGEVELALLDVVMPRLGGVEALERMRQTRPGLRAVLMSGQATARARDLVAQEGVSYLPKPFLPQDLTAIVAKELSR